MLLYFFQFGNSVLCSRSDSEQRLNSDRTRTWTWAPILRSLYKVTLLPSSKLSQEKALLKYSYFCSAPLPEWQGHILFSWKLSFSSSSHQLLWHCWSRRQAAPSFCRSASPSGCPTGLQISKGARKSDVITVNSYFSDFLHLPPYYEFV